MRFRRQIIIKLLKSIQPEAKNNFWGFCQENPFCCILKMLVVSNFEARVPQIFRGGRGGSSYLRAYEFSLKKKYYNSALKLPIS